MPKTFRVRRPGLADLYLRGAGELRIWRMENAPEPDLPELRPVIEAVDPIAELNRLGEETYRLENRVDTLESEVRHHELKD